MTAANVLRPPTAATVHPHFSLPAPESGDAGGRASRKVLTTMTDPKVAQETARQLQAIAEPNRIRIIDCLRTGQKNVTQLATLLDVEIVNVSHHLGVLKAAGLVEDKKDGRFVIYSLHPKFFSNDRANSTHVELGWCKIEIPNR
jgi:DNA-binding transcriptional ArsR family regulator